MGGTDKTTGKSSTLRIPRKHAGDCDYDFAMLVNENVNVDTHCSRMPAASQIVFSNITLDGVAANWTTRMNCKGNPSCDCGNSAAVSNSGDVVLGWNTEQ